jgi:transposase-like protein
MNPQEIFCPNQACPARGQAGAGNISVHSRKDRRYKCSECGGTFTETKGSIFYRIQTDSVIVTQVITLLAYGCPLQAIVQAFGFDERTIKVWWQRAGVHCEAMHAYIVGGSQLDLQHVQADEIKVKTQGGRVWMAMALMVSTRLWLGGAISATRDRALIQAVADQIRAMALCRDLLLAVDGFKSYVTAFQRAFRTQLPRRGRWGRPSLVAWSNVAIVQVVKHRSAAGLSVERRIVQGCATMIHALLGATQDGGNINTAYIERLNATFRQRLSWLTRRTRTLAQQAETLVTGMYVVGCMYNFCDFHDSLRVRLWIDNRTYRWVQRTPAMAAGLIDHGWTIHELFAFKVPPPRWTPPKRRGRRSKETLRLIERWCQ